ncbi:phosphoglycerate kinase [Hamiltosporidium magnivora]|uniref:Phosphoglycerate kinase n=1 Tax=Hamiltosporidium magnivora TaxID=148818 RepID=A0A4Q9LIU2_9MICR|nr:phosphoglycerate kinase [Hamiltosporidium magnivora]
MNKKTLEDIQLTNKRIFLRVDYNIPTTYINNTHQIQDTYRIISTIPTIKYILSQNPKLLVIGTHFGRPKGNFKKELSLNFLPPFLEQLLHLQVEFSQLSELENKLMDEKLDSNITEKKIDNEGKSNNALEKKVNEDNELDNQDLYKTKSCSSRANNNRIILLENLRFYMSEENEGENLEEYRKYFTKNFDITVVDAFGVLHRKVNSIQTPTRVCGLLLKKELEMLEYLKNFDLLIIGGSKVTDKVVFLKNIMKKCKKVYVVGKMCYVFIKVLSNNIINTNTTSEEEKDILSAKEVLQVADKFSVKVYLPKDFLVKEKKCRDSECSSNCKEGIDNKKECISYQYVERIEPEQRGVDIGMKSIDELCGLIRTSKSVFWNGPVGIYEEKKSSLGTERVVKEMEKIKERGGVSIVGGGDTVCAVGMFGDKENFSYVSTGGGALLKCLEGSEMPGLNSIEDK